MITKLRLFLALFRQGQELADATRWKNKQIKANEITVVLATVVAIAAALGYEIPFSDNTLASLGVVLLAAGNWLFTILTSKKVGLTPKPEPVQPEGETPVDQGPYFG